MSAGNVDEEALAIIRRAVDRATRDRLKVVGYEVEGLPGTERRFRFFYAPLERTRKTRTPQPKAEDKIRRRVGRGVARDPVQPAQGSLL